MNEIGRTDRVAPMRVAMAMLVSSAAVQSFVCVLVAWALPPTFSSIYRIGTIADTLAFMPDITRLAVKYAWVFPLALAIGCSGGIVMLRRFSDHRVALLTIGLCAQASVTWIAMFCFCYQGFLGDMSLHHEPEFEPEGFVVFGAGIFPVTFVIIMVPALLAWRSIGGRKQGSLTDEP